MRVLIDTNIVVYRERDGPLDQTLQIIFKIINQQGITCFLHPITIDELRTDKDTLRRAQNVSKVSTYPSIESYPRPDQDDTYIKKFGSCTSENDIRDRVILYSLYRHAVDFFLTNDEKLLKRASNLGLSEKTFDPQNFLDFLHHLYPKISVPTYHASVDYLPFYSLDINDPFFDSLKEDYPEFCEWFEKKSSADQKAYVIREEERIKAMMAVKEENESITLDLCTIQSKNRLKISLFKSEIKRKRLGEFLLKIAFDRAIKSRSKEIYLHHNTKPEDPLLKLITPYGFEKIGYSTKNYGRPEDYFLKNLEIYNLILPSDDTEATNFYKKIYPIILVSATSKVFLVPIIPEYHERLFIECKGRNNRIIEWLGEFLPEGNAIKKAYICNANNKNLRPGDILLFYKSRNEQSITTVGVVEETLRTNSVDQVLAKVAGRTVYSHKEISHLCSKEVLVILFRWHFDLNKFVDLEFLRESKILKGQPQSIVKINTDDLKKILEVGDINESLVVYKT